MYDLELESAGGQVTRLLEGLVEVSPEKKVVWAWRADVPAVHHFQVLSVDGKDLEGPALR